MKKYKESSLLIFLAIFVLLCISTGIRLFGLSSTDLWADEALSTLVSQSLILSGELSNSGYSDFVPSVHYQNKIWVYFPPLYYIFQAPFMLLKNILPPNIVARIPALISSILLITMLYFISKSLWKSTALGLVAVLLATFNGFQIYMSRSAESYSLLPALLCLAFYFLLNALNKQERRFWVLAGVFFVLSFYTNQMSLLFVLVWIVGFVISFRAKDYKQTKNLLVYCLTSVSLCLPWLFIQRHAIFNQINQAPQNYISLEKLLRILTHYYSILGNWMFVVFFLFGFGRVVYDISKKSKPFDSLLLVWIFLLCVYFFSKTTWINPHHMFFVFPPVILVTAYGAYHLFHFLIEKIGLGAFTFSRSGYNAVFLMFFLIISVLQIKFAPSEGFPRAAEEFGKSDIVSRACDYIKKNYNGEIVIAPIGLSEAYYLDMFVYDKNESYAAQKSFDLISKNDAWVFTGDNYFKLGKLDEFDLYVQKRGKLIMHSKPIVGFTDSDNQLGYALYHIGKQVVSGY